MITVNEAWRVLLDAGMTPDLVMGDSVGNLDERLCDAAVIVNMMSDCNWLKNHAGQKFFYLNEDGVAQYLCMEAQKESDYRYVFNVFEAFQEPADNIERAICVAEYIQEEHAILLGAHATRAEKMDTCRLPHVECHVRETLCELLPIMDEKGEQAFDRLIHSLGDEARQMTGVLEEGIALYHQLYCMAETEIVVQEELNDVVARINEVAERTGQSRLSVYVQKIMEECQQHVPRRGEAEPTNEIEAVALDGLWMSEVLQYIFGFFADVFLRFTLEIKENGNSMKAIKSRRRILLVSGESQYSVIDGFVEELKYALQSMGVDVYLWKCNSCKLTYGYSIFQCTVGYDYIILMNGVGLEGIIASDFGCPRFWYENDRTKVAAIFLDHPQIHEKRLQYINDNVEVIYDDKYWCEYIRKYMPQIQSVHRVLIGGRIQEQTEFEKKENKVVFFGSKTELLELEKEIETSTFKAVIWELIKELIEKPVYTVEEMIRQLGKKKYCLHGMESIMLHSNLLISIQKYMRAYFREKVIMELAASGIRMDLYGWNSKELESYKNVTQKAAVSYEEMLAICRDTRFVLNVQPWTKDTPQERIFNAMLGGSIAVTDVAEALQEEYRDGENIIFYRLEEIEKLPEKIRYYMEHTEQAKALAECGYQITAARHTTAQYAKELLQVLDDGKLEEGEERCRL